MAKSLPKKDMNHLYKKMKQVHEMLLYIWVTIIVLAIYGAQYFRV